MKTIISIVFFSIFISSAFSQKNKAIFLVHSTGTNLYSQGKVSEWVKNYNSVNGTNFQITARIFPSTPWPWANYPYDYWKLWADNSCDNNDLGIECLPSIASGYDLVIFKHCYPGAGIGSDTGKPDITSKSKTIENYKLQYRALRNVMDGMPNKKFMVWTLVPQHRLTTSAEEATRANQFVNWVKNQWLTEDGQAHPNIFIFDFYSLAAEMNENPINGQQYCLKYDYEGSHFNDDSHPNRLANETIGPFFAQTVINCLSEKQISSITVSTVIEETSISTDKGTLQLLASVLPTNATSKSITWSVINETGKASINSSGLLTADRNGTVKVIATATNGSGIKDELQISITNQIVPLESITLSSPSGTSITIDNGTLQLLADLLPTDATSKTVNWSVTNVTGKASISSTGFLTADRNGTVKAFATATDGSGVKSELQISISNQIVPLESISLSSPSGTSITVDNGTLQLLASVLPTDATSQSVIWSVINETGNASISSTGLLGADRNGTVKAIATATDGSGIKGELQISISNQIVPIEIISLSSPSGTSITIDDGTLQLLADLLPTDATSKTVNWSVTNETGKASISSTGLLTADRDGTIKAVATATDGSGIKGELQISITNQIVPLESISLSSPSGTSITTDNGTLQLLADLLPTDATTKSVEWSVTNETGKASISSTGLLSADRDGTIKAVAIATDGSGIKSELQISISNQIILIENLEIVDNLRNDTINGLATMINLEVSINPLDATNQNVDWSVENITGLANIDDNGILTPLSEGLIRVTAAAKDQSQVTCQNDYQITIPVGIGQPTNSREIKIFPNPTSGIIQIQFDQLPVDGAVVEIRNSIGQVLDKKKVFNNNLNWVLKDNNNAFYFVTITTSNKVFTEKIFKLSPHK